MEWVNLHSSTLNSPEFKGSEPVDRATWLCLLHYCFGQENSGIIDNCFDWSDRKWQQLCAVTKAEVERPSTLWRWIDKSIAVHFYPIQKQVEIQDKRESGRKGGFAKNEAKTKAAQANGKHGGRPVTKAEPKLEPKQNPSENRTEEERKSKRKGRERAGARAESPFAFKGDGDRGEGKKSRGMPTPDPLAHYQSKAILEALAGNPDLLEHEDQDARDLIGEMRARFAAGKCCRFILTRVFVALPQFRTLISVETA